MPFSFLELLVQDEPEMMDLGGTSRPSRHSQMHKIASSVKKECDSKVLSPRPSGHLTIGSKTANLYQAMHRKSMFPCTLKILKAHSMQKTGFEPVLVAGMA